MADFSAKLQCFWELCKFYLQNQHYPMLRNNLEGIENQDRNGVDSKSKIIVFITVKPAHAIMISGIAVPIFTRCPIA